MGARKERGRAVGNRIKKIGVPKGDERIMGLERSGRIRVLIRLRPFLEGSG